MAKRTMFYAVWNGETFQRGSETKTYTHAAVYRNADGAEYVGSWHSRADLAAKGVDKRKPISVVEVTTVDPDSLAPADSANVLSGNNNDTEGTADMAASTAKKTATTKPTAAEAKHIRTREEIAALIERVPSLVEAENAEGIATVKGEAEELIQTLPTGERTALRATLDAAVKAEPKPAPKAEVAKVEKAEAAVAKVGDNVAGLVAEGSKLVTEAAVSKFKSGHALANVLFEIRRSIILPDGTPDLLATSPEAKKASEKVYTDVTQNLPEEGSEKDDEASRAIRDEINSIKRGAQNAMPDVRTAYLRSLDTDAEEAKRFGELMKGKSADIKVSETVAEHYGVQLATRAEIAAAKRAAAKMLTAAEETLTKAQADADATEAEAKAKVEAEEMTEAEAKDAVEAAQAKVAEAEAAVKAAKGEAGVKETTKAETLADAVAKLKKFAKAADLDGVADLSTAAKASMKKDVEGISSQIIALLAKLS